VALLVRLLFLAAFGAQERYYDGLWDQPIYWDIAQNLVAGEGFSLSMQVFTA
jgi:hypothetical protein